ncbi:MAG: hypothetical protein K2W97_01780 [Chthoniobacterales bacterium]|nr:hypothetical protein [Chthoniobacterales bacterium]
MTAVQEIALAIDQLPEKDFWFLTNALIDMREFHWDQKIIEDALPGGPLDLMAQKAQQEFHQGKTYPLP